MKGIFIHCSLRVTVEGLILSLCQFVGRRVGRYIIFILGSGIGLYKMAHVAATATGMETTDSD